MKSVHQIMERIELLKSQLPDAGTLKAFRTGETDPAILFYDKAIRIRIQELYWVSDMHYLFTLSP